ncbi:uncharacterized protein JCM6883_001833 [Sporobolomyces salmoneus]|uniref:uncharacterized protein n=1 Tax=Sporobolomyces salmoneus TaxID=183962 RepID=UPI003173308E
MEQLLKRAHEIVFSLEVDASEPSSKDEISRLISSFENGTPTSPAEAESLPDTIAQLPQEILVRIAELVKIPRELCGRQGFGDEEEEEDSDASTRKREALSTSFKSLSTSLLKLSLPLLRLLPIPSSDARPDRETLSLRSALFIAYSRFLQPDFSSLFSNSTLYDLSSRLLKLILSPETLRLPLLSNLLRTSLPVYFKPHPKLNPSTGRLLNRPLGGPTNLGSDMGEDEAGWKREGGVSGTVLTVIQNLRIEELEEMWPWLLPPVLSFLDDYNTENKVLGLHLLDTLIEKLQEPTEQGGRSIGGSLLTRTGVGKVFEQSLTIIFSNLSDPLSVKLQSLSQPVSLKLINLLYPPPSPFPPSPSLSSSAPTLTLTEAEKERSRKRFEALCRHFTETIMTIWNYKSGYYSLELLVLSTPSRETGLVPWMQEMGRGVIRYLGILVPHLTGLLHTDELAEGEKTTASGRETLQLRLAAVKVLRELTRSDRAGRRIKGWEEEIVSAVGRCWVEIKEGEMGEPERELRDELERELKGLVRELKGIEAGKNQRDYWKELKELDPIFEDLVA